METIQKQYDKAEKELHDFMEDVRSNFIGGLTLMTPTQSAILNRLYEKVNTLSSLLLEEA
jgi:hypothetical protein